MKASNPRGRRNTAAYVIILVSGAALLKAGCVPSPGWLNDGPLSAMGIVPTGDGAASDEFPAPTAPQAQTIILGGGAVQIEGRIAGESDYDLFTLGASRAGDRWVIERQETPNDGELVVALFNQDMQLLVRSENTASTTVVHVTRRDSSVVFMGVAGPDGRSGDYRLHLRRTRDAAIPPPRPQLVWLNFAGHTNLTVGEYERLSFGSFNGADLGESYAGVTAELKQAILETLRRNYADFLVTFITSDEARAPDEPHATVHFGGYDEVLLGWADNVDAYNADLGQNAIVFVKHFAVYATMNLDAQDMGRMIGNTASHELGHLLGLHHTCRADSIMDISAGGAWDHATERVFDVADLDPDVFPVGKLNAPQILADTVGLREDWR